MLEFQERKDHHMHIFPPSPQRQSIATVQDAPQDVLLAVHLADVRSEVYLCFFPVSWNAPCVSGIDPFPYVHMHLHSQFHVHLPYLLNLELYLIGIWVQVLGLVGWPITWCYRLESEILSCLWILKFTLI